MVTHGPEGWQKLDRSQNYKTPLYSIYLMNIQKVSSSRLYNWLQSVNGLWRASIGPNDVSDMWNIY